MAMRQLHDLFRRFAPFTSGARRRRDAVPSLIEALEVRVVPAKTPIVMGSVIVERGANFFTTEDGGSATFTVELSTPLIAKNARKPVSVSVPITTSNNKEGTVNVTQVTFSVAAGQTAKTVTITGVDDNLIDGDKAYNITLGKLKVTNAKNYTKKMDPSDLTLINKDNDHVVPSEPGLSILPTELIVNDASSKDISFRLTSQPTADVHILLDVTEGIEQGTISSSELVFTTSNWNVVQKVSVGMYLEGLHDGDLPFSISVETTSSDPDYDEMDTPDIAIVNHDIDPLEFSLPGRYVGSYHTEAFTEGFPDLPPMDGNVEFVVEDGVVTVTSPGSGTGTYAGDEITFTTPNGMTFSGHFTENADSTVTASGVWAFVENVTPEATGTWSVKGPIDDQPGLLVDPNQDFSLTEGEQKTIAFSLLTQPTQDVTVSFTMSSGTGEATLSNSSLVFTSENWNVPQFLTVTAVEDHLADGDQLFVVFAGVASDDPNYVGIPRKRIAPTIVDSGSIIQNLDGSYVGTFEGTLETFLGTIPVSGAVEFTVSGDQVTVTQPGNAVGTVSGGIGSFSAQDGSLVGATFSGSFTSNPDGSITAAGTWSYEANGFIGSGTWTSLCAAP